MTPKPVAPAQLAALAQLVARKLMKLMALVHLAPLCLRWGSTLVRVVPDKRLLGARKTGAL